MMRRGQSISTDMLVAFAIFIFILYACILLWESQISRAQDMENRNWEEEAARAASSQLMSPGEPSNWQIVDLNKTPLHSFGLTNSNNVIQWDKLNRAAGLNGSPANYQLVKHALGLDCCDLWFGVMYSDGTVLGSFGNQTPANSSSVTIDRNALLNSSPVVVRLRVWQ